MAEDKVRYICPVCDHELKYGKHFCWKCKSRVDEPWRYTGGHLPNEGHEGCHPSQTYMKPRTADTAAQNHGGRNLAGKNNASKQYTYNRPGQGQSTVRKSGSYGGGTASGRSGGSSGKNSGCGSLVFIIVLFYLLIQVLIAFFR